MTDELVDDIYDVTRTESESGRIRAFLVETDGDGLLVDTGLADSTDALLDGIAETGVDVEHVAITHADRDHLDSLNAVVERHDPSVHLPVGADPDVAAAVDTFYGDEIAGFDAVHVPGHRGHQHVLVFEAGLVYHASSALGSEALERYGY